MSLDFVAFDLDGTLFSSVGKPSVSQRVIRALQAAHDTGAQVICASGRPWMMVGRELMRASWLDWQVGLNGSDIIDRKRRHVMMRPLAKEFALEATATIRPPGCTWQVSFPDAFYFEYCHAARFMRGPLRSFRAAKWDLRGPLKNTWYVSSVVPYVTRAQTILKISVAVPEVALRAQVIEQLTSLGARYGGLEIANMDYGIEITAAGVDKGTGTQLLLDKLDIDPRAGVVFGDSANDLPMTGKPWTFVAMGNAIASIKAIADEVTDPVTEDGVASWLERHMDLKSDGVAHGRSL